MMELKDAVEAREAALREVAKLLAVPSQLEQISTIRADYLQRQQANEIQLNATVQTVVEDIHQGGARLDGIQVALTKVRDNFKSIERLCEECSRLIEHPDIINLISMTRKNLEATLRDVEGIATVPEELGLVKELLRDDDPFSAFEPLCQLEGRSRFAFAALEANITGRKLGTNSLTDYVEMIAQARRQFESMLWKTMDNCIQVAKTRPSNLVKAVRVIEMQEKIDDHLKKEGKGVAGIQRIQERGLFSVCIARLEASVDDKFSSLLPEFLEENISTTLEAANLLSDQLADVYEYVGPCFPSRYDIAKVMTRRFNRHFYIMLCHFGERAKSLKNNDIIEILKWMSAYERRLARYGCDETITSLAAGADSGIGIDALIEAYVERMKDTMKTWSANMVEADKQGVPKMTEDGKLWSPAPVDFFRMMSEQVGVVQETATGGMLTNLANAAIAAMYDFQEAEKNHLRNFKPSMEYLCALGNNNLRSKTLADELLRALIAQSSNPQLEVEVDQVLEGFQECGEHFATAVTDSIFGDPGVKELMSKVYDSSWHSGEQTEILIETLRDFFGDVQMWLEPELFSVFTESVLEFVVSNYIVMMMKQKVPIKLPTVRRMQDDENALRAFFDEHLLVETLQNTLAPLADLRELAGADSADSFVFACTILLRNSPHASLGFCERVVNAREDLLRKEKTEALEAVKETYANHKVPTDKDTMSGVWRRVVQGAPAAVAGQAAAKGWFQAGIPMQGIAGIQLPTNWTGEG